jgi:hypothetical protein
VNGESLGIPGRPGKEFAASFTPSDYREAPSESSR